MCEHLGSQLEHLFLFFLEKITGSKTICLGDSPDPSIKGGGVSPASDGSQTKSLTEYALATNHALMAHATHYVLRDCQPGKKDLRGSGRPESGAGATALSEQGRWAVALKKPKLQREEQTASALLS